MGVVAITHTTRTMVGVRWGEQRTKRPIFTHLQVVSEVDECIWNSKEKTLSTPRDEAMEAARKNEEAEWYMNLDFLDIGDFNKNNKKLKYSTQTSLLRQCVVQKAMVVLQAL